MFDKHYQYKETAKCPVCSAILGSYDASIVYKAHCDECRATFWWKPNAVKPTAILDADVPEKCGCNTCRH